MRCAIGVTMLSRISQATRRATDLKDTGAVSLMDGVMAHCGQCSETMEDSGFHMIGPRELIQSMQSNNSFLRSAA